ncbi:hypothetical protein EJ03DRAFT_174854 [Teratosphaeria nubilosa]|uniref:Uncharacterized protein n=1 Tax=Teratosphaeria nubilosa TaxID=161662 RepID=A0A6G1L182_9PEZI|nr:hypothetical protein EJ03DRAFT_174854 [Teratosphaeria nubilosa]
MRRILFQTPLQRLTLLMECFRPSASFRSGSFVSLAASVSGMVGYLPGRSFPIRHLGVWSASLRMAGQDVYILRLHFDLPVYKRNSLVNRIHQSGHRSMA